MFLLPLCLATVTLLADIDHSEPSPTLAQQFGRSDVVALVRIESGETEHYGRQIYKARVTEPFKGAQKDEALYFSGGNIGAESYGPGELYLLLLRSTGTRVGDAHVKCCWSPPDSRFPQDAQLFSPICVQMPIVLRYSGRLDSMQAVFIMKGGCMIFPATLIPRTVGSPAEPSLVWLPQGAFLAHLRDLAGQKATP